jgi:hypothetical protein
LRGAERRSNPDILALDCFARSQSDTLAMTEAALAMTGGVSGNGEAVRDNRSAEFACYLLLEKAGNGFWF